MSKEGGGRRTGSYRYFQHTADVGLEAQGADLEEAFAAAAAGLCALMVDPATVRLQRTWSIRVTAPDYETLLVRWLNEIIYRHETRGEVYARFGVSLESAEGPSDSSDLSRMSLHAKVSGEKLNPTRHRQLHEVKAATYHGISVENPVAGQTTDPNGGCLLRVVLDV